MRQLLIGLVCFSLGIPAAASAQQMIVPPTGRYQLVVAAGIPGSPFLVDSTTGCVWSTVQDQESKRTAFIEVEVQNLHWSLASQAVLSQRIEGTAELNADQKRALKGELERTRCGSFSVLMTPEQPGAGRPGETKGPAKAPPTKR